VHGEEGEDHFGDDSNVAVTYIDDKDDVMESIEDILSTEDSE
jgi:phage baseplate assembly protein W